MSYESAITNLLALGHELHGTQHKFELQHVRTLVSELGDPQARFKSVLIAGTNGKGSTAATLASILKAAGHRTGLYTSPHLVRVNERIRINGEEISNDDFANAYERVEATAQKLLDGGTLPWHPSFFEMLTAMAFLYFAEAGIEIAVLEVGMGGRLDATNIVEPCVSVITDISLDHQKFLGNTITEIAGEKAGIIRPDGIVVTLPQHPEANAVIGNTVLERGARAVSAVQYVPPVSPGAGAGMQVPPLRHPAQARGDSGRDDGTLSTGTDSGRDDGTDMGGEKQILRSAQDDTPISSYRLDVMGEQITVESPLVGRHQLRNVALAIATAEQLNGNCGVRITPKNIERGIRETRWPGRFQVMPASSKRPEILLDVAHNPAGAWALRSALSERYADRPVTMVFGIMHDKAVAEVVQILFPIAGRVLVTHANNPRSATAEEIRDLGERISTNIDIVGDVAGAIERACCEVLSDAEAGRAQNGVVVVTGSIYIVGEALAYLERQR
jgi:dihydrofolate synthase/folylpolyglutamate synthase